MTTRTRAFSLSLGASFVFAVGLFVVKQLSAGSRLSIAVEIGSIIVLFVIIAIGTLWVLYFKRKGLSYLTVGLFPAVAIVPFCLFTYRVLESVSLPFEGVVTIVIAAGIFSIFLYLLVLTANILNGAILFSIPLGQAGKAAQFIFSLLSMYFLVAYLLGTDTVLLVRMVLVAILAYYLTFSAVWCLQLSKDTQVNRVGLSAGIVLALFTALVSVWPIPTIYATVVVAAVFYMILNVALELREHIRNTIWIEYVVITFLIIAVLLLLGEWGINGTLL